MREGKYKRLKKSQSTRKWISYPKYTGMCLLGSPACGYHMCSMIKQTHSSDLNTKHIIFLLNQEEAKEEEPG